MKFLPLILISGVVIWNALNVLIDWWRWRRLQKRGQQEAVSILKQCDEYMKEHE